jgi:hypothetical protein
VEEDDSEDSSSRKISPCLGGLASTTSRGAEEKNKYKLKAYNNKRKNEINFSITF